MRAHELARALLDGPDMPVVVSQQECRCGFSYEPVVVYAPSFPVVVHGDQLAPKQYCLVLVPAKYK